MKTIQNTIAAFSILLLLSSVNAHSMARMSGWLQSTGKTVSTTAQNLWAKVPSKQEMFAQASTAANEIKDATIVRHPYITTAAVVATPVVVYVGNNAMKKRVLPTFEEYMNQHPRMQPAAPAAVETPANHAAQKNEELVFVDASDTFADVSHVQTPVLQLHEGCEQVAGICNGIKESQESAKSPEVKELEKATESGNACVAASREQIAKVDTLLAKLAAPAPIVEELAQVEPVENEAPVLVEDTNVADANEQANPIIYGNLQLGDVFRALEKSNDEQAVRLLLNRLKAQKKHKRTFILSIKDNKGDTLLHRAVEARNGKMIDLLLEDAESFEELRKLIQENKNRDGVCVMQLAINWGYFDIVKKLYMHMQREF